MLENALINKAKILAKRKGKSLSKIVAKYFAYITSEELSGQKELPPLVKSLYGSLAKEKPDESDYKDYLEKKYL